MGHVTRTSCSTAGPGSSAGSRAGGGSRAATGSSSRGPRGVELGHRAVRTGRAVHRPSRPTANCSARDGRGRGASPTLPRREARATRARCAAAAETPGCRSTFVDAELTLDDRAHPPRRSPWDACDATPLFADLSARFGLLRPVARPLPHGRSRKTRSSRATAAASPTAAPAAAGARRAAPTAIKGGCSTGSCSRGKVKSADELTAYFADLRQKMEAAGVDRTRPALTFLSPLRTSRPVRSRPDGDDPCCDRDRAFLLLAALARSSAARPRGQRRAGRRNRPRAAGPQGGREGGQGQRGRRPGVEDAREQGRRRAVPHPRSVRRRQPDRDQLAPRRGRRHRREGEGRRSAAPAEGTRSVREGHEVAPSARRVAYELLVGQDADREGPAAARVPQRPSPRTSAATRSPANSASLEKAAGRPPRPTWRSCSRYTRDKDQVDLLAKKIGETRREGERQRALRVRHHCDARRPVRQHRRARRSPPRTRRRRADDRPARSRARAARR